MAVIAVTAAQVAPIFPDAVIRTVRLSAAVTAGQGVYTTATGLSALSNGGAAGTAQLRGIALEAGAIGDSVSVLQQGEIAGYTLTALDYDAPVYVSDTAGALDTAVGTVTVAVGRVVPMVTSGEIVKVLRITRI